MSDLPPQAARIIKTLGLSPHPEGGYYRETWVAKAEDGTRPSGTCIYFLLAAGKRSHWHRVDAVEIWHYYAGAPLSLWISQTDAGPAQVSTLGSDVLEGQQPQGIVPQGWWQSAQTLGEWTLVGCTVSPGFQFAGFDLADPDFDIPAT